MDEKEIENEVRVIESILRDHTNPNIIAILGHGKIECPGLLGCFIDMELCNQTLDNYIHKGRLSEADLGTRQSNDVVPVYATKNSSPLTKLRNIWVIMGQVANGLEFMHARKQVHRDLKPRNGISVCHI